MCLATALDKAFENIDCMSAILRCQAKNRFYESTQCLIQPRPVLCIQSPTILPYGAIIFGNLIGKLDVLEVACFFGQSAVTSLLLRRITH
jgi:hypothetical protein